MKNKFVYKRKYATMLDELQKARKATGLSQAYVGKHFGAHASFVSKCESGKRRIDVVELQAFCKLYRVSLSEFLQKAGLR